MLRITKSDNKVYKQESDDETKRILFSSITDSLNQASFKNREIINYDPVISKKNTHELVTVSDFAHVTEMLNKFNDENQHLPSTKRLDETQFHMYMVNMIVDRRNYKIFGKLSNVLELEKKFLFGNFTNNKIDFTKNSNVFGFSKKIELLGIDDNFILINQAESKFESLFKMNQMFSSEATAILNDDDKIKQIFSDETREKLIDKVSKGKRVATRLIKITSDSEQFNQTIANISKIEDIIKDSNYKFHNQVKDVVYDNGQLSVIDGQEIQLIDAISDAFYQAVISQTENVNESRM